MSVPSYQTSLKEMSENINANENENLLKKGQKRKSKKKFATNFLVNIYKMLNVS